MIRLSLPPLVALRLAAKGLRRAAGTTGLAVFVLALGLAAPATFFSLLVGAIRPLPVPEGDRVARVDVVQPERDGRALALLLDDLSSVAGSNSLDALGAFQVLSGTLVDGGTTAIRLSAAALTPEVLPMLRVQPLLGRMPGVDEAGQAVLLAYEVWQEIYSGDPSVLGRAVDFNDVPATIVGVMPEGFAFPYKQNAWTVLDANQANDDPVEFVARLADGTSFAAATAELAVRWSQADAERDLDRTGGVLVLDSFTGGRGEGGEAVAFLGLVLVALCLLLIACANVANLLMVRAAERVRALSIQAALGASRAQIGGQLLLEALLISLLGGAAGLFLAWLGVDAIQTRLAAEHWGYYWMDMAIDGRVLAFTSILIVGTALVSGMLPALRVMKVDVQQVLKEESAGSSLGGGTAWGRAFVTIQLALSCGALVAAGLTGRAMSASRDFAGSLPTDEILTAIVPMGRNGVMARGILEDALVESVAALQGVSEAALALGAPGYLEPYGTLEFDGVPAERVSDRERGSWNAVTPGYFRALDLGLLAGRAIAAQDREGTTPVAVVNESFVERFSPDQDILGRTIRVGARPDSAVWHTVVGVVSDARVGVGELVRHDRVYLPFAQVETQSALLILRAPAGATTVAPALRQAISDVDPRLAISSVRSLEDGHDYMTRIPRAMGALAVGGGIAGLLVAAVGLYGLLSFRVRRHRRELGIRLALGADGARLGRDTLEFALRQLVPAVAVGLTLAWVAAPLIGVMLLGLNPRGVSTYVGVAAAFLAVGLLAAGVPAWRASLIDPAQVLRGE